VRGISPSQRPLTAHNTHNHALCGIRTRNRSKRATADPLRSAFPRFVSCDGQTGPSMQEILVQAVEECGMEERVQSCRPCQGHEAVNTTLLIVNLITLSGKHTS
jgi:hypothetical protein